MSENIYIGNKVTSFESSPEFDSYAGVIINIDEDTYVSAGDITGATGRVLEVTNPYGTQAMASNMLTMLSGFQYQPYSASQAILDPAAELGDGVTVRGVYGGIYSNSTTFGKLMNCDISAPNEETVDHEYPYTSSTDRKIERQRLNTKAEFQVLATQISAKVSKESASGTTSFGWKLLDDSWTVFNQSGNILKATASGLEVTGKITATSGAIGSFNIGSNAIWNNISEYGGTQSYGVYLGTNGIQLGQNFKVDSSGGLTASNANITGSVNCSSLTVGGSAYVNFGGSTYSGSGVASGVNWGNNLANVAGGMTTVSGYNGFQSLCARMGVFGYTLYAPYDGNGGVWSVKHKSQTVITSVSLSASTAGTAVRSGGGTINVIHYSLSKSSTNISYLG